MSKSTRPTDDKKFNETLQNLLKAPPGKHADEKHPRKVPPKKKAAKRKPKGKEPD